VVSEVRILDVAWPRVEMGMLHAQRVRVECWVTQSKVVMCAEYGCATQNVCVLDIGA
jgi:hypothetical protein